MRIREVRNLVNGTSDTAFAVDGTGHIVAWNHAAESLFDLPRDEVIGKMCCEIVRGMDECGQVCSTRCVVRQAAQNCHTIANFDLQVKTAGGSQWCNVSVMIADNSELTTPYAIHIVRQIDVQKRFELLVRDYVMTGTRLPAEQASALMASGRSPARESKLSDRELGVLRLLAKGNTTTNIAHELHISRTTVHNHVQRILRKLGSHTRLEAIRRAEHAGLI
jgi:PAS domain S-box-containing protein